MLKVILLSRLSYIILTIFYTNHIAQSPATQLVLRVILTQKKAQKTCWSRGLHPQVLWIERKTAHSN